MLFKETKLKGAFLIVPEKLRDERGFFARSFCKNEFKERGLDPEIVQSSISYNRQRHTLRGMHYQLPPGAETKVVRCTRGSIYDVMIDLRKGSRTYCKWASYELTAKNYLMLYIPEGIAHGFITLENDTDVLYQMSEYHAPKLARGVRWNDPAFGVRWPAEKPIMSGKDQNYEDYTP
jgi:dTDP-4-dehydrorhamnose 3,5-epimerase